jgi:hypothetical protein
MHSTELTRHIEKCQNWHTKHVSHKIRNKPSIFEGGAWTAEPHAAKQTVTTVNWHRIYLIYLRTEINQVSFLLAWTYPPHTQGTKFYVCGWNQFWYLDWKTWMKHVAHRRQKISENKRMENFIRELKTVLWNLMLYSAAGWANTAKKPPASLCTVEQHTYWHSRCPSFGHSSQKIFLLSWNTAVLKSMCHTVRWCHCIEHSWSG